MKINRQIIIAFVAGGGITWFILLGTIDPTADARAPVLDPIVKTTNDADALWESISNPSWKDSVSGPCAQAAMEAYKIGVGDGELAETIKYTVDPEYHLKLILANATSLLVERGLIDEETAGRMIYARNFLYGFDTPQARAANQTLADMLSQQHLNAWLKTAIDTWCLADNAAIYQCAKAAEVVYNLSHDKGVRTDALAHWHVWENYRGNTNSPPPNWDTTLR